jgi:Gas vesicle protein G
VAAAADIESADPRALREQLLDAGMKLELGEITNEEYQAVERDVLARLRLLTGGEGEPVTMKPGDRVTGVDVEVYDDRE